MAQPLPPHAMHSGPSQTSCPPTYCCPLCEWQVQVPRGSLRRRIPNNESIIKPRPWTGAGKQGPEHKPPLRASAWLGVWGLPDTAAPPVLGACRACSAVSGACASLLAPAHRPAEKGHRRGHHRTVQPPCPSPRPAANLQKTAPSRLSPHLISPENI